MVNFRSKSSSQCRATNSNRRNESPIRKALNIKTKHKLIQQFENNNYSFIALVTEDNQISSSVVY